MIKRLPRWVLTNDYPAFNDTESVTAIEMVARLYGKMQELINNYNEFVDSVNTEIDNFEKGLYKDFDEFKECVMKLMSDYIETIDTKINLQDLKIEDAIQYMKDNIIETATNLFNEFLNDGNIYVSLGTHYNAETRELTFGIDATPSEELIEALSELTTPGGGE